jgi:hypothetical protein
MKQEPRKYANAGMQGLQGRVEMRQYINAEDATLFTVKCISLVLGIRLQMVKQIPVTRIMIDKRGYYRKGDIGAWLAKDMASPESLIEKLRDEHAKTLMRMMKHGSRRYRSGELDPADAKAAKEATTTNRLKPASADEIMRDPGITRKLRLPEN